MSKTPTFSEEIKYLFYFSSEHLFEIIDQFLFKISSALKCPITQVELIREFLTDMFSSQNKRLKPLLKEFTPYG